MEPQANNNDPAQKSPAILPLPSRKNSSLIIVFSLLLLGLISSIAYLVYQNNLLREEITSLKTQTGDNLLTPTPTIDLSSDLKSYADQEEKFEIKYPSDWTIGDLTVINTETNIKSMSIFPPSSIDAMAINIHVYKIDNFILPITKYIEKQKQECLDFMENSCKDGCVPCMEGIEKFVKETYVGKYPATKTAGVGNGVGHFVTYYIVGKNNVYSIYLPQSFDEEIKDYDNLDEEGTSLGIIYQKILSSFKILDQKITK